MVSSLVKWQYHFQAFRELALLLTLHRRLTLEMAKREIQDRYLGQVFGIFWAFGHPLVMMAVYVFIFAFVFKSQIGGAGSLGYATYLLSGLIPWLGFQESMGKGSTVIVSNAHLVKQAIFPIELLPVKGVIASLITQVIFLLLLMVYVLVTHYGLPWTYALLPLLVMLQALAMVGVSYILAAVGTYFRDVKDFVQIFSIVGIYLMPAFYLPEAVPALFRPVLYLNPFSYLIWCYQDALFFGRFEHSWAWVILTGMSMAIFYVGYRLFRKLKVMFGNVL